MKAHMKDHLDLTLEEAVARLQGRYADDIAAYDKIHVQILEHGRHAERRDHRAVPEPLRPR